MGYGPLLSVPVSYRRLPRANECKREEETQEGGKVNPAREDKEKENSLSIFFFSIFWAGNLSFSLLSPQSSPSVARATKGKGVREDDETEGARNRSCLGTLSV